MRSTFTIVVTVLLALGLASMSVACGGGGQDAGGAEQDAGEVPTQAPSDAAAGEPDTDGAPADGAADPALEAPGDDEAAPEVIATVNGEPLAMADFQRQAFDTQRFFVERGLDPNTDAGRAELMTLRRQVLVDMINQVLIDQAAAELGITVTAEEAEAIVAAHEAELGAEGFEQSLAAAGTTREDVLEMERKSLMGQRFVETLTADVPAEAEFVRARHILCESEEDCQAALERLRAGEDFATVAAEVSIDEMTAERGGDLDWVPRVEGATYLPSPQMEAALRALDAGGRSDVFASDFGYHVLEVVEVDPARALSDDQRFQLVDKAVQDWLAEERAAADIVIYIEDLRDVVGG